MTVLFQKQILDSKLATSDPVLPSPRLGYFNTAAIEAIPITPGMRILSGEFGQKKCILPPGMLILMEAPLEMQLN